MKDWTNIIEKVTEGFHINRTGGRTEELYQQLVDSDGDIERKTKDFNTQELWPEIFLGGACPIPD